MSREAKKGEENKQQRETRVGNIERRKGEVARDEERRRGRKRCKRQGKRKWGQEKRKDEKYKIEETRTARSNEE